MIVGMEINFAIGLGFGYLLGLLVGYIICRSDKLTQKTRGD